MWPQVLACCYRSVDRQPFPGCGDHWQRAAAHRYAPLGMLSVRCAPTRHRGRGFHSRTITASKNAANAACRTRIATARQQTRWQTPPLRLRPFRPSPRCRPARNLPTSFGGKLRCPRTTALASAFSGRNLGTHDGSTDHVGGSLLAFGASSHRPKDRTATAKER